MPTQTGLFLFRRHIPHLREVQNGRKKFYVHQNVVLHGCDSMCYCRHCINAKMFYMYLNMSFYLGVIKCNAGDP